MKKSLLVVALAGVVLALGVLFAVLRTGHHAETASPSPAEDLIVTIDNQVFSLRDGLAEIPAAAGSAGTNTVRIVGEPVMGDINSDGKDDAALLIRNDPGGSGTFYYAVVAVNDGGSWWATNTVLLGDRVKPEKVEYRDGRFVYRFLERRPEEPMATTPKVEKVVTLDFDPASQTISVAP